MFAAHPGGRAGQPVPQFPFAVALAAAPAPLGDGDPAADLGEGLVRQLHQVEVIHDEGGSWQDLADRGLEDRAHVDRDEGNRVAPGLVAFSQPVDDRLGGAAFDLPEQALPPGEVHETDVPTVHGGLPDACDHIEHPPRPASADLINTEDSYRFGLGRQHRLACSVNAAATTGQDTAWSRAAWTTVRPASATAAPAEARNRLVNRFRDGTVVTDSVNERRRHAGSSQRQRRLVHTSRGLRPPTGRSRGRVTRRPLERRARVPQSGQCRACSSAVTRCTTGPSVSSATPTTARPSRPSSRVVSLTTPIALLL